MQWVLFLQPELWPWDAAGLSTAQHRASLPLAVWEASEQQALRETIKNLCILSQNWELVQRGAPDHCVFSPPILQSWLPWGFWMQEESSSLADKLNILCE